MLINRKKIHYTCAPHEIETIKLKMLDWLSSSNIFGYLDNNFYNNAPNRYEVFAAVDAIKWLQPLSPEINRINDWLFGHILYDLKNDIEPKLSSGHYPKVNFPQSVFFVPETVIYIKHNTGKLCIESLNRNPEDVLQEILQTKMSRVEVADNNTPKTIQCDFTKEEYLQRVAQIQSHIVEGDCYELNFCVCNYVEQIAINPIATFRKLNQNNPSPFAALYRQQDAWLISASPERFLYKEKDIILSQPIKGTIGRKEVTNEDEKQKTILQNDIKERAENVMITDLVRNDLARCSVPGSIEVPELFGVYTFPKVHHLISTIKGKLQITDFATILNHTFPMGSMTGAPKFKVMQLIEQYEKTQRSIYSGSVGYITPNGDFDFNVVIRSLIYNEQQQILSNNSGGAITYDSNAEKEWQEIELKSRGILESVVVD